MKCALDLAILGSCKGACTDGVQGWIHAWRSPVAVVSVLLLLSCVVLLSRGAGSGDGVGRRWGVLERREAGGVHEYVRCGADMLVV